MLSLYLLLACTGGADSNPKGDSDPANTDDTGATDTGDGDTAPACATVTPGEDWAWLGECPRMTTPVVIAVESCALTLDYDAVGGMTMGMPYSATISGDAVTFAGDNSVTGCVGTVETADQITGSCDGGCTFTLSR